MNFDPQTPEEEVKLHALLSNADAYKITITLKALALDGEVITQKAIERVQASNFSNEDARIRVIEAIKSDIAQAIGVLLEADKLFSQDSGVLCRSASHHVELVTDK